MSFDPGPPKFKDHGNLWEKQYGNASAQVKANSWMNCKACGKKVQYQGYCEPVITCRVCGKGGCAPCTYKDTCKTPEEVAYEKKQAEKEAERLRLEAEAEAARIKAEAEAARLAAEEAERQRLAAEEAERQRIEMERIRAEQAEADRVAYEQEMVRRQQQAEEEDAYRRKQLAFMRAMASQNVNSLGIESPQIKIVKRFGTILKQLADKFSTFCKCKVPKKLLKNTFKECQADYPTAIYKGEVRSDCGFKTIFDKSHMVATESTDGPSVICPKCLNVTCIFCEDQFQRDLDQIIDYFNEHSQFMDPAELDIFRNNVVKECCQKYTIYEQTFIGDRNNSADYLRPENYEQGRLYCSRGPYFSCKVFTSRSDDDYDCFKFNRKELIVACLYCPASEINHVNPDVGEWEVHTYKSATQDPLLQKLIHFPSKINECSSCHGSFQVPFEQKEYPLPQEHYQRPIDDYFYLVEFENAGKTNYQIQRLKTDQYVKEVRSYVLPLYREQYEQLVNGLGGQYSCQVCQKAYCFQCYLKGINILKRDDRNFLRHRKWYKEAIKAYRHEMYATMEGPSEDAAETDIPDYEGHTNSPVKKHIVSMLLTDGGADFGKAFGLCHHFTINSDNSALEKKKQQGEKVVSHCGSTNTEPHFSWDENEKEGTPYYHCKECNLNFCVGCRGTYNAIEKVFIRGEAKVTWANDEFIDRRRQMNQQLCCQSNSEFRPRAANEAELQKLLVEETISTYDIKCEAYGKNPNCKGITPFTKTFLYCKNCKKMHICETCFPTASIHVGSKCPCGKYFEDLCSPSNYVERIPVKYGEPETAFEVAYKLKNNQDLPVKWDASKNYYVSCVECETYINITFDKGEKAYREAHRADKEGVWECKLCSKQLCRGHMLGSTKPFLSGIERNQKPLRLDVEVFRDTYTIYYEEYTFRELKEKVKKYNDRGTWTCQLKDIKGCVDIKKRWLQHYNYFDMDETFMHCSECNLNLCYGCSSTYDCNKVQPFHKHALYGQPYKKIAALHDIDNNKVGVTQRFYERLGFDCDGRNYQVHCEYDQPCNNEDDIVWYSEDAEKYNKSLNATICKSCIKKYSASNILCYQQKLETLPKRTISETVINWVCLFRECGVRHAVQLYQFGIVDNKIHGSGDWTGLFGTQATAFTISGTVDGNAVTMTLSNGNTPIVEITGNLYVNGNEIHGTWASEGRTGYIKFIAFLVKDPLIQLQQAGPSASEETLLNFPKFHPHPLHGPTIMPRFVSCVYPGCKKNFKSSTDGVYHCTSGECMKNIGKFSEERYEICGKHYADIKNQEVVHYHRLQYAQSKPGEQKQCINNSQGNHNVGEYYWTCYKNHEVMQGQWPKLGEQSSPLCDNCATQLEQEGRVFLGERKAEGASIQENWCWLGYFVQNNVRVQTSLPYMKLENNVLSGQGANTAGEYTLNGEVDQQNKTFKLVQKFEAYDMIYTGKFEQENAHVQTLTGQWSINGSAGEDIQFRRNVPSGKDWTGWQEIDGGFYSLLFEDTTVTDGKISGGGLDQYGYYQLGGKINADGEVSFEKVYTLKDGKQKRVLYKGKVEGAEVKGTWEYNTSSGRFAVCYY